MRYSRLLVREIKLSLKTMDDLHQSFALDAVPQQCDGYEVQKIPCCWILKEIDSGRRIKLNDSGMMIWDLCDGKQSVGELITFLKEQFPDAADSMEKDVQRTLDELVEERLITMG